MVYVKFSLLGWCYMKSEADDVHYYNLIANKFSTHYQLKYIHALRSNMNRMNVTP